MQWLILNPYQIMLTFFFFFFVLVSVYLSHSNWSFPGSSCDKCFQLYLGQFGYYVRGILILSESSVLGSSGSDSKVSTYNVGDPGSVPRLERSPGEGNDNPFQYSCLENSMDRGAWWCPWGCKQWDMTERLTHPVGLSRRPRSTKEIKQKIATRGGNETIILTIFHKTGLNLHAESK